MYTKINNAYMIKGNLDLEELNERFLKYKKDISEIGKYQYQYTITVLYYLFKDCNKVDEKLAKQILNDWLGIMYFGFPDTETLCLQIDRAIREGAENQPVKEMYNFECSAQIIPLKDKTIIVFYGDHGYNEYFNSIGLKDYSFDYNDQGSLSDKEYHKRKKDWDYIVENEILEKNKGFFYYLFDINDLDKTECLNLLEDKLSKEERLNNLVIELMAKDRKYHTKAKNNETFEEMADRLRKII